MIPMQDEKKMTRSERDRNAAELVKRRARLRTIAALLLIAVIGGWFLTRPRPVPDATSPEAPEDARFPTRGSVHWHADVAISTCDHDRDDLLRLGSQQGHVGGTVLHTHGDGKIHVEGLVSKPDQISLGKFFDAVKLTFDRDRLLDYGTSGKTCGNETGSVKMTVNGEPNEAYREYVFTDGDRIELRYE